MKYKLALDFQFTRFWAVSLLAVVIASAVASNSFNMSGMIFISRLFLAFSAIMFFLWVYFLVRFLVIYKKFRSKLKD
jgi:hypothetical protein